MPKPTKPFNSVESQKLWSIILIMTSVFIIFYTPPIILFTFGNFNFTAGNYQLIAGSDDGIHVYLNGTLLTNPSSWVPRAYIAEGINFTITPAEATTPQQITVEYFQHAGGRVINVSWTKL